MKLLNSILFISSTIFILSLSSPSASFANDINPEIKEYEIGIEARAEQVGYKYKIMYSNQYKRLWSYTYERWVDPDWTLA